jgi:hypothetical protein
MSFTTATSGRAGFVRLGSGISGNSDGTIVSNATLLGLTKSSVGLGSVENTALSTWAGSSNITTVGTVTATSITLSITDGVNFPATGNIKFGTSSPTSIYATNSRIYLRPQNAGDAVTVGIPNTSAIQTGSGTLQVFGGASFTGGVAIGGQDVFIGTNTKDFSGFTTLNILNGANCVSSILFQDASGSNGYTNSINSRETYLTFDHLGTGKIQFQFGSSVNKASIDNTGKLRAVSFTAINASDNDLYTLGEWQSWSPSTLGTLGNGSVSLATYSRVGNTVFFEITCTSDMATAAVFTPPTGSLPAATAKATGVWIYRTAGSTQAANGRWTIHNGGNIVCSSFPASSMGASEIFFLSGTYRTE